MIAMATIAESLGFSDRPDMLSGTPRAHSIDRWIFVFMAAWFIAIVLAGFIPDSLAKIAAVSGSGAQATPGLDNDTVRVLDQAEQLAAKAGDSVVLTGHRARDHSVLGFKAETVTVNGKTYDVYPQREKSLRPS